MNFNSIQPEATPLFSVIIRTYNEELHLEKLLLSIQQQETSFPFEVIVVDSGSEDGTLEIARAFPVRVLRIEKASFSFGKSLNLGIAEARGAYCAIISAHCYPTTNNWLQVYANAFNGFTRAGVAYGRQIGFNGSRFSETRIFLQAFPESSRVQVKNPFCNNANSVVKKSSWARLGGYDEKISGLEDIEFANRLLGGGEEVVYLAEATVVHIHQETPRKIYLRYYREGLAFRRIFPNQRFGFRDFLLSFLSAIFWDSFAALHQKKFRVFGEICMFRFLQFFATWRSQRLSRISKELASHLYYPSKKR